eukprot:Gb_30174 [translate_table: standard]
MSMLVLGMASVPPPAIQCDEVGCTILNSQGIWEDGTVCRAAKAFSPRTEIQLVEAVAEAVKNKQKIKVISSLAHSLSKLACVGEKGVIISTVNYGSIVQLNKSSGTVTVEAGAHMRDVIDAAAKELGMALPSLPYWDGVSAAGVISTGSHGSGLFGRGSAVHEYVVGMRLVIPASAEEGYAQVISLTEEDEELKAGRLSLGVLGAISHVTFKLEPMFKRRVSLSLEEDVDLEQKIEDFLGKHEFGDIYWYPAHYKAIFGRMDRVSVDVGGDGVNKMSIGQPTRVADVEELVVICIRPGRSGQRGIDPDLINYVWHPVDRIESAEDSESLCSHTENEMKRRVATGSGFFNNNSHFTGYPVIGFNHQMQTTGGCQDYFHKEHISNFNYTPNQILDKNDVICRWDYRFRKVWTVDMEIQVPISSIREAIADMKRVRDLNPKALCEYELFGGIQIRSIKKSAAYMGYHDDVVSLGMHYYRRHEAHIPKWNMEVYEEIEQMLVYKHGGRPHWGKSGGYIFEEAAKRAVSLGKFMKVKEKFDGEGVFSNEWTEGLLGRGVEVLRKGCGMEKMCICRGDEHCATHKGYFCRQGRTWNKARGHFGAENFGRGAQHTIGEEKIRGATLWEVRTNFVVLRTLEKKVQMESKHKVFDHELTQSEWDNFSVPPSYRGNHNLYLLAQEISTSMSDRMYSMEASIQEVRNDINHFKDVIQGINMITIHVMYKLAYMNPLPSTKFKKHPLYKIDMGATEQGYGVANKG